MIGEPQPAPPTTRPSALGPQKLAEAARLPIISPAWYLAAELWERIASLAVPHQTENHTVDLDLAQRRLRRWREQPPFTNESLFARRLAADGLDEDTFLQLLGEPAEAVRDRFPPPPAWLGELVEALSTPSPQPGGAPHLSPDRPHDGFLRLAEPLIRRARERLRCEVQALAGTGLPLPFDPDTAEDLLAAGLPDQLLRMMTRTLVLELHVARLQGLIEGESPEERFESFLRHISDPAIALALFEEYPVLARQLVRCTDHWLAAALEFLGRLCADWGTLRETFSPDRGPGTLTRLTGGAGDKHREGRSVLIAEFSSGLKLVYKPRALTLDVHFQELLTWLNRHGDHPPLRTLTILDRGTHGWVEFVPLQPCSSPAELDRFYRRQGCYLALLHALEATDFHCENLIAAGEHPVLLDLEALFHPHVALPDGPEASRLAAGRMDDSVLRVGLLPQRVWSNAESVGVDMSGLGGTAGQLTPFGVPQWEGAGTDTMHLVRKRMEMPGSHNRPTLDGAEVDPLDHVDALLDGFIGMYRFLQGHRHDLLAPGGPLTRFAGDEVRVVLRATQTYATLLQESFHPDVLRDALDQARLFDRLWVQAEHLPHLVRVIPAELRDLEKGDIPLFVTRPGSRDLLTSANQPLPDFFDEPALDVVRRRLRRMSEDDLQRQVWFIRASLATLVSPLDPSRGSGSPSGRSGSPSGGSGPHPVQPAGPPGGQTPPPGRQAPPPGRQTPLADREELDPPEGRLLAAARAAGDRLETLALRGRDDVSWIGLTLADDRHWMLSPAGIDLYDGLSGIALFLAHLGAATRDARYTALAQDAVRTVRRELEGDRPFITCIGGFGGWGGVIYALTHLASLWDDPELLDRAASLVERVLPLIEEDTNLDIIAGAAGCIGGLLALHRRTRSQAALQAAIRCGDHLLARAQPMEPGLGWIVPACADRPLTGFSHGAAGIAWSLLHLAAASGEERFRTAGLDGLAYERSVFSPETGNWPDFRDLAAAGRADGDRPSGRSGSPSGRSGSPSGGSVPDASYMAAWCHGAPGIGLARLALLQLLDDPAIHQEVQTALRTTLRQGFGSLTPRREGNHSLCHGDLGNVELLLEAGRVLGEPRWQQEANRVAAAVLESIERDGWLCGNRLTVESPGLMTGLAGIGYGLLRCAEPDRVPSVLSLTLPGGG